MHILINETIYFGHRPLSGYTQHTCGHNVTETVTIHKNKILCIGKHDSVTTNVL